MSTSQTVIGNQVSANTQAILLLTAPLITGRGQHSTELLTASEYAKLARFLHQKECQPADLVVAGGYGHSRLFEWAFGGMTRSLLSNGSVNRLFSN